MNAGMVKEYNWDLPLIPLTKTIIEFPRNLELRAKSGRKVIAPKRLTY